MASGRRTTSGRSTDHRSGSRNRSIDHIIMTRCVLYSTVQNVLSNPLNQMISESTPLYPPPHIIFCAFFCTFSPIFRCLRIHKNQFSPYCCCWSFLLSLLLFLRHWTLENMEGQTDEAGRGMKAHPFIHPLGKKHNEEPIVTGMASSWNGKFWDFWLISKVQRIQMEMMAMS